MVRVNKLKIKARVSEQGRYFRKCLSVSAAGAVQIFDCSLLEWEPVFSLECVKSKSLFISGVMKYKNGSEFY